MDPLSEYNLLQTRRHFFKSAGLKVGRVALASLLFPEVLKAAADAGSGSAAPLAHPALAGLPHFAPKAKRIIYLFMNGAPSQMDLLDYKPKMAELFDKDIPPSVRGNQRLTTMTSGQSRFPIAPSIYKFAQHGKSGAWFSELLKHTATVADDLAIVKTVYTEAINHDPAVTYIQTGSQIPGKPSFGSWLAYGLGSECTTCRRSW